MYYSTDLVGVVAQPVREAPAHRGQQQSRGLNRVAGDRDVPGALQPVSTVGFGGIHHPAGFAGVLLDVYLQDHAVGAHFHTVGQCVGQVRDIGTDLGVDLAALQAVTAVDAVRAVAERAVDDPYRADPHFDPASQRTLAQLVGGAGDRMRGKRVAVRVAPRPVLTRHR